MKRREERFTFEICRVEGSGDRSTVLLFFFLGSGSPTPVEEVVPSPEVEVPDPPVAFEVVEGPETATSFFSSSLFRR